MGSVGRHRMVVAEHCRDGGCEERFVDALACDDRSGLLTHVVDRVLSWVKILKEPENRGS